jgi:hypothetical protein
MVPECACSSATAGVNDLPRTYELGMRNLAMPGKLEPDCMGVVESVTRKLRRVATCVPTRNPWSPIRFFLFLYHVCAQMHNLESGHIRLAVPSLRSDDFQLVRESGPMLHIADF